MPHFMLNRLLLPLCYLHSLNMLISLCIISFTITITITWMRAISLWLLPHLPIINFPFGLLLLLTFQKRNALFVCVCVVMFAFWYLSATRRWHMCEHTFFSLMVYFTHFVSQPVSFMIYLLVDIMISMCTISNRKIVNVKFLFCFWKWFDCVLQAYKNTLFRLNSGNGMVFNWFTWKNLGHYHRIYNFDECSNVKFPSDSNNFEEFLLRSLTE